MTCVCMGSVGPSCGGTPLITWDHGRCCYSRPSVSQNLRPMGCQLKKGVGLSTVHMQSHMSTEKWVVCVRGALGQVVGETPLITWGHGRCCYVLLYLQSLMLEHSYSDLIGQLPGLHVRTTVPINQIPHEYLTFSCGVYSCLVLNMQSL